MSDIESITTTDRMAVPATAIVFFASLVDWWSHAPQNMANLERRASLREIPVLGDRIAGSIGNAHYSAAMIIGFALAGQLFRELAVRTENEKFKSIAIVIELAGLVFSSLVNLLVEGLEINAQTPADLTVGLGIGALALCATVWGLIDTDMYVITAKMLHLARGDNTQEPEPTGKYLPN